jgi:hypothetical protein
VDVLENTVRFKLIVFPTIRRAFAEYYKAYSVAIMPGPERANLAYGGKSAFRVFDKDRWSRVLAFLTALSSSGSHHATFRACQPQ